MPRRLRKKVKVGGHEKITDQQMIGVMEEEIRAKQKFIDRMIGELAFLRRRKKFITRRMGKSQNAAKES